MRKILFRPYFDQQCTWFLEPQLEQRIGIKTQQSISGFDHKESEAKIVLVFNAGQDLPANTGRKYVVQGHYKRIASIVQQFSTLQPEQHINLIAHELSVH